MGGIGWMGGIGRTGVRCAVDVLVIDRVERPTENRFFPPVPP